MEKKEHDSDTSNGYIEDEHLESQRTGRRPSATFVDHRDFDDRAEEARGRNADQIDKKYWYSWRFLGSMLAVGTSFMGGIGGK